MNSRKRDYETGERQDYETDEINATDEKFQGVNV